MTKTIALIISLGCFPALAFGQGKPDPLQACYQQPDGAPRLACFNKEMKRRQGAAIPGTAAPAARIAAAAPAATAAVNAAPKPPADDTVGLQGRALRKKLEAEGVKAQPVKPIIARVIRRVPGPHSLQAFVLDNGQTWEQVEAMDNLDVRLQDTVTIRSGILGGFFLNTPRNRRVRVRRIL